MSRWRIYRQEFLDNWTVYKDGDWQSVRPFVTWREAMDYADRMARTCEITLPAPVTGSPVDVHSPAWHVGESFTRPWVASIGRFVHVSDGHGWGEQINADVAERYALAMLAAAKHAKGEQQ